MGRILAFADLHGQLELWKQIKQELKPDDKIYCLGDCVDRGPAGITILKEVLADPRIVMLKGNHEEFLEDYLKTGQADYTWIFRNGGGCTKNEVDSLLPAEKNELLKQIENLKLRIDIETQKGHIILSHAGCGLSAVKMPDIPYDYTWNRNHLIQKHWLEEEEYADIYVVHGHSPIPCFWETPDESKTEVKFYCDNHKVDIDTGAFFTGRAALIDLDTFEIKYFKQGE